MTLYAAMLVVLVGLAAPPVRAASTNPPPAGADAEAERPTGRAAARRAQDLMRRGRYTEAERMYRHAARGATGRLRNVCLYNAAAAAYRAGRHAEAATLLADVLHDKTAAPEETAMALGSAWTRAAETTAATNAAGLQRRAAWLEQAGEAFKQAARTDPGNATARRNLAVLLDDLPAAREDAKIAALMDAHGGTPPDTLLDRMLREQRALLDAVPAARTNAGPHRIAALETLAARQTANAELMIPLKAGLLAALQGQADPSGGDGAVEPLLESTRDTMHESAALLRDLDPAGIAAAQRAEAGLYHLWKAAAAFPALLQEDLRRQTNAILAAAAPGAEARVDAEQNEAAALTGLFAQRFAQQVPESGLPPAPPPDRSGTSAATNTVGGISAGTRAEILELARAAEDAQHAALNLWMQNARDASRAEQRRAHALLKEIEARLPKDPSQSQQQQQDQDQQQQDQQQEQDGQQQGQDPRQDQQDQPQPDPAQPEEQPEEQDPEEQPDPEADAGTEPLSEDALQRVLDKALQREQEHLEEKRRRARSIPLSPGERDW
jgi:hypothetical protein